MIADTENAVTTVLGWARELSIIGAVSLFGWKSRGLFQEVLDFKNSIVLFMLDMRGFAQRVEANHLTHMENYLKTIAKFRGPYVDRVYESADLSADVVSSESDDASKI